MDAMELAAARHGCKVCWKSFPCGRSLGGHMRSHLSLGEATAEAGAEDEMKHETANFGGSSNGVVGYGLRENPRKTRRLSDFADEEEEEEDGGDGERKACQQCGKLFRSWRSLLGHMRSHATGGRDRDEEDADVEKEFVPEDAEAEEVAMVEPMDAPVLAPAPAAVLAAAPRRRRRTMRVAAPAPALPPVLSGFEKEQEDVALCLLMLSRSRDTGLWSTPVKAEASEKESDHQNATRKQARLPRKGYAYNSDEHPALLQYGDARIKRGSVAKSRKRSSPKQPCKAVAAPKRTRYECPGCARAFTSYQALGGHRASYKRINTSCSAPKVVPVSAPELSAETYTSFSTMSPSASPDSVTNSIGGDRIFGKDKASAAAEAVQKFECPICFKVFASGQALGEHKRSHLLADDGDHYDAGADQERHVPAADGFLDLNFPPAPAEGA